jgi:hypothetical protein
MIRIGRTIIAVLIGLSVATLPATLGFAASVATTTAMEISATQAMPDCDHHHHAAPSNQTKKTADDGACMAGCALTCFNFTAACFSAIVFSSPASAALKPVQASNIFASQMGSPPFRPPRV